ncbi:MAG: hypothetical protein M3552_15625 [Planctomycetota bacterium]|nr:hypothetical protein [Planctomycetaceae bacterium]MDQ3332059.1 hypothetical protein [Planctomycetota bacterium]
MAFRSTLTLWAALTVCASVSPVAAQVWPAAAYAQAQPSPPPASAPDIVSPPSSQPREGFVPSSRFPAPDQRSETKRDDDPVGRRFVEPPSLPEPPPGLDIVIDAANPAFAGPPLTLDEV